MYEKISPHHAFIESELSRRKSQNRFRQLRSVCPQGPVHVRADNRCLLNFCSNDYLGLSKHPLVLQRSAEFLQTHGAGATASRLICGHFDQTEWVEKKLANLKGAEAALILNSGFQANLTVLPAILDRNSLILSDQLNHNSLILGARLSRCQVGVYRHNDMSHLEHLLAQNQMGPRSRVMIVTESVFSMDGDICDLNTLESLAEAYQAWLMVDDAHATGVMGEKGMGLTAGRKVDVVMGTFGKAAGSFGAYLAGTEQLKSYMVNCCAGLIYSTGLPPSVIGAIDAALDLIPGMADERNTLRLNADYLRASLQAMGYDTGASCTQIIPVIVGDEADALSLSRWLEKNNILVVAIRPPTVPEGRSRIRISLSAQHTRAHIDQLLEVMEGWRRKRGPLSSHCVY